MRIEWILNGRPTTLDVDPGRMLLDVLRNELDLKGTKEGCGRGECGACTVILNGRAVLSCLLPMGKVQGGSVTTIEGLASGERLHPLQEAFIEAGAVQCGFCTPGMILSAKTVLDENRPLSEDEIRTAISGNLCRCTGYDKIVEAIKRASTPLGPKE